MYFALLHRSARDLLSRRVFCRAEGSVYLNMSHQNLGGRGAILNFRSRTGARLVFFVHDLIPITHPEYARPGQAGIHRRRMDNVGELADAVIVNSTATKQALIGYFRDRPAAPPIHVAHLGVANSRTRTGLDPAPAVPYFLCLGTIEPRKNHLLLLNLWRSLAHAAAPRLIIVGRRGWENEMVLDMLERCAALTGLVEERRDVSDAALAGLMQGAKALLLPSFAEGYGLPVAEALGAGTPVICSDLPALREVGGDVPEYIDPLDGVGWRRAILDYAAIASPRRAAQSARLVSWSAPGWDRHFSQVREIVGGLLSASSGANPGSPVAAAASANALPADAT
jgi:glycosyltransferase involved in cell wall biosynthesis